MNRCKIKTLVLENLKSRHVSVMSMEPVPVLSPTPCRMTPNTSTTSSCGRWYSQLSFSWLARLCKLPQLQQVRRRQVFRISSKPKWCSQSLRKLMMPVTTIRCPHPSQMLISDIKSVLIIINNYFR